MPQSILLKIIGIDCVKLGAPNAKKGIQLFHSDQLAVNRGQKMFPIGGTIVNRLNYLQSEMAFRILQKTGKKRW